MPDDDGRAVLERQHLAQARDIVGERRQRELRRADAVAGFLQALDDAAPARPVGPCAMDQNDVRTTSHFGKPPLFDRLPIGSDAQADRRQVWLRARAPRIARTRHSFRGGWASAVCSSDHMGTVPTPANEAPDTPGGATTSPRTHQPGIQGREPELRLIGERLDEVASGSGRVIVVEGASGIGKTRLLLEAVRDAKRRGMRVGVSMAEPSERTVELAALLRALFDGGQPLIAHGALPSIRTEPGQRFWLLRDLRDLLERSALSEPIVIVIDDVQWADAGTAAALRALPRSLAGSAIAWLIAWRPSPESAPD